MVLALLALAPHATAQDPADSRVVEDRERGRMHPGDPLVLIGNGDGDNDFRARTPALQQTDGEVAYIDREALRQQRLAMYAAGSAQGPAMSEVFPSVADHAPSNVESTAADAPISTPGESDKGNSERAPLILMALGGLVALGALGAAARSRS